MQTLGAEEPEITWRHDVEEIKAKSVKQVSGGSQFGKWDGEVSGGEETCLRGWVCICVWAALRESESGELSGRVGVRGKPCERELIKVTFVGDAWGSEASFGTCVCGAKLTVNTNNQSAGPIEPWRQWNEGERLARFALRSCSRLGVSEWAGGGLPGAFTGWKCLQNRQASPLTEESAAALLLSSYCVEVCFSF